MLLLEIQRELGENAVVDFDRDIATTAECKCGHKNELFIPVHNLKGEMLICPKCRSQMQFDTIHTIKGDEDFLDKTPYEIGIPPLHIVCGRIGMKSVYFEFTGDESDIFSKL